MSISTRKIERWICDRCGVQTESPDEIGKTARERGWIVLDLTRSLTDRSFLAQRNEQVLCPADCNALRNWFQSGTPGQESNRRAVAESQP